MLQLDALRCFAVLAVLFTHTWAPGLPWIFGRVDWGHFGVELFFVLSGFLITGILLDSRDRAEASGARPGTWVRRFYIRRFLRIFPIYYLTLIVLFAWDFERVRELSPWLFSYTTNLYISSNVQWIGTIGHFWTLAVEEQFYLFWPWLIVVLPRRWLTATLIGLICLGPISRGVGGVLAPTDIQTGLFAGGTFTFASWDSLGSGALLAVLVRFPGAREAVRSRLRVLLPVAITATLAVLALDYYLWRDWAWFVLGDVPVAVFFCWLIATASSGFGGIPGRILSWRPFVYVGTISYGVYLFHPFVAHYLSLAASKMGLVLPVPGFELFILTSVVTVLVAGVSWRFFEAPINGLKSRFSMSPQQTFEEPLSPPAPPSHDLLLRLRSARDRTPRKGATDHWGLIDSPPSPFRTQEYGPSSITPGQPAISAQDPEHPLASLGGKIRHAVQMGRDLSRIL